MTRRILAVTTAAALGLALTAPAFANNAALAGSVGVEPGVYTTAELIQLSVAMEEGNAPAINRIMNAGDETISSQGSAVSAGDRQLAAALGVAPGAYSTADLVALTVAMEDNDQAAARYILSGGSETVSSQGRAVNGGDAQLAAYLGVNAADYSTNALAGMYLDATD